MNWASVFEWHKRFKEGKESVRDDEMCGRRKKVRTPCFKGVQEEILSEEASNLQIVSVAFPSGQCTSQQLHPCHRLFDQDGHQDRSSASLVQTLLPVTFGYSQSSEAQRLSLWDNWGCDEGHWHARTRGLPLGLQDVAGAVQQMHCSGRWLLRRGLEFHLCTLHKSAHMKIIWKLI